MVNFMLSVFTIKNCKKKSIPKFQFLHKLLLYHFRYSDRIGAFPLDFFLKPDVLNRIVYKVIVN